MSKDLFITTICLEFQTSKTGILAMGGLGSSTKMLFSISLAPTTGLPSQLENQNWFHPSQAQYHKEYPLLSTLRRPILWSSTGWIAKCTFKLFSNKVFPNSAYRDWHLPSARAYYVGPWHFSNLININLLIYSFNILAYSITLDC